MNSRRPLTLGGRRGLTLPGVKATVTLPQNLILSSGSLWEDFEAAGDWTAVNGAVANNAAQFKTGAQSVKATTNAAATETITRTINTTLGTAWQQLRCWYYCHDTKANYGSHVWFRLSNDAGVGNYYRIWHMTAYLRPGWNHVALPKNWWLTVGAPHWANPLVRIQLQVTGAAAQTPSVSFDTLTQTVTGVPFVLFTFDDGYNSQYANVFPYMRQYNLPGTVFVRTSIPNAGTTLTYAQLREMDAAGWCIGNHTQNHNSLGGETEANQETYIGAGKSDLIANGLGRNANIFAYPSGSYDDNSITACTAQGVLAARTTDSCDRQQSNPNPPVILPNPDMFHINCTPISTATPLAMAKSMVDDAITGGVGLCALWHDIGSGGAQWSLADFQALVDYVRVKALAGQIYPITMADYYRLSQGAAAVAKVK